MHIQPKSEGLVEAKLYAKSLEGHLIVKKVGYSPVEALEALIVPLNGLPAPDSLLTPRIVPSGSSLH